MDNNRPSIRILIADDHPIFRDGLRKLLEAEPGFQVVGEAADGIEAIKLVQQLKPDILLLDLAMPRLPGLETLRELTSVDWSVRTIILTAAIEKPQIVEALQLGARGVVMKESATAMMLKSIRSVMDGEFWVGRESVSNLVNLLRETMAAPSKPKKFGLTSRELEVVAAIVSGYTNKDIAQKFSISEQTVKHHLTSIFDKLGVANRLELALFAVNNRLTDPL
ncbi:MAG TPA: response regulator transcription factor [Terriglobia bacterium]|nr:response regulator transcription factor [Terriglobia bacterium]